MIGSDQAVPERNSTTLVYIRVKRDLQDPIFESVPYRVTVKETDPVGKLIYTLRGRDDDRMVSYVCQITHEVPPYFLAILNSPIWSVYCNHCLFYWVSKFKISLTAIEIQWRFSKTSVNFLSKICHVGTSVAHFTNMV